MKRTFNFKKQLCLIFLGILINGCNCHQVLKKSESKNDFSKKEYIDSTIVDTSFVIKDLKITFSIFKDFLENSKIENSANQLSFKKDGIYLDIIVEKEVDTNNITIISSGIREIYLNNSKTVFDEIVLPKIRNEYGLFYHINKFRKCEYYLFSDKNKISVFISNYGKDDQVLSIAKFNSFCKVIISTISVP